jgi:anaerobic magnesium-protoporphyrin IX monomethyl ester cyclase
MKVLLVCPPWNKLFGGGTGDVPLGVGYLAAVLRANGIETDIYNADFRKNVYFEQSDFEKNVEQYAEVQRDLHHPLWQEIKRVVSSFDPTVVGINATTPKIASALNVAALCKEIDPNIRVVIGGPHASCLPEEILQNECVDFVVRGEGERTLLNLIKTLEEGGKDFESCPGLSFKMNGTAVSNPDRPLMENLDDVPFPVREFHIDETEIRVPAHEGTLFATRGCPSRCVFCASHKIWTRKVRYRSPENVVAEMEYLKEKYGLRYMQFDDDSFTLNKGFVTRICDLLVERKVNVDWYCSARVDAVSKELLLKMKKSGCIKIFFGVESGSEETLRRIKKGITKEEIAKAFETTREAGIYTGAFVMIGFPWETREHMLETVRFSTEIRPNVIVISIVTPYPGTELYDMSADLGILPPDMRFEYLLHQNPSVVPVAMTGEEFRKTTEELLRTVESYNRKQKIHQLADVGYMIKTMKRYRRNPGVLLKIGKRLIQKAH